MAYTNSTWISLEYHTHPVLLLALFVMYCTEFSRYFLFVFLFFSFFCRVESLFDYIYSDVYYVVHFSNNPLFFCEEVLSFLFGESPATPEPGMNVGECASCTYCCWPCIDRDNVFFGWPWSVLR